MTKQELIDELKPVQEFLSIFSGNLRVQEANIMLDAILDRAKEHGPESVTSASHEPSLRREIEDLLDEWDLCSFSRNNYHSIKDKLRAIIDRAKEHNPEQHPLYAGYVIIDGEERELRRSEGAGEAGLCPFCNKPPFGTDCRECNAALQALDDDYLWLAPKKQQQKQEPQWKATPIAIGEHAGRAIQQDRVVLYWNDTCKAWFYMNGDPSDDCLRVEFLNMAEALPDQGGFCIIEPAEQAAEGDSENV